MKSIKLWRYLFFIIWFNCIISHAQSKQKYINITSPKGTEEFGSGQEINIQWEFNNLEKVNIFFQDIDLNKTIIVKNFSADKNEFIWKPTDKLPELIKIIIIDSNDSLINSTIPFYISIKSNQLPNMTKNVAKIDKVSSTNYKSIMPLGDSITRGYISGSTNNDGYRKELKAMLETNGLNFDFIGSLTHGTFDDSQHEGHGSFSAKHFSGNIKYDLYSHLIEYLEANSPDIILFHIGTNDINDFKYSNDTNVSNTTVSDVSSNLDLIYDFNPNIIVIVAKIINRTDDPNTTLLNETNATHDFNIALEIMLKNRDEYNKNLFVVNMESALEYPQDLSDGIHPNAIGYQKMSPIWFNGIKNILPKLKIKIFLQGTFAGNNLMNSYLASSNEIPHAQPFNMVPWNFVGTEFVNSLPSNIVDWVLVSLRSSTSEVSTVAQRAGFLKTDGTVVDLDGISPLAFVVDEGLYYVVVEHRNHLPVMSSTKVNIVP